MRARPSRPLILLLAPAVAARRARAGRRPASPAPGAKPLPPTAAPATRGAGVGRAGVGGAGDDSRVDCTGCDHGVDDARHGNGGRRRPRRRRRQRPAAGPFEPGADDTAGVTDAEIVIGIHAPVTGASPIPQTSFDIGKDIYWQFLADSDPDALFGRNVRVVFRDDEFNPQNAVQVCREMVEQEGAFLLVGGGGADQITACAQYASEAGIPYLSAGVNEAGLSDLDTYFATTLTYAEQAPMIIAQLQERGFTETALVVTDTPSFDDAYEALKAAADDAGITIAVRDADQQDGRRARAAVGGAGAEELRRRSGDPAQLAGRVHRARQPGPQPELHADVDRSRHHERAQRGHRLRLPRRRHRRVLLADPGPRRHRPARPRLQPGLRAVRRRRAGGRHRDAAVVAEQGRSR